MGKVFKILINTILGLNILYISAIYFDVIRSIKWMESTECMYEKVSRNVTVSVIHRNTQIIVMW